MAAWDSKKSVCRAGSKMVHKLSELRGQLCSNGRRLKTHPASPSLQHKHMCLGNSHIALSVSNLHLPVPACGWGPSCPSCVIWVSLPGKHITTQKSSMAFPGPGSALPVLGSLSQPGLPRNKEGQPGPRIAVWRIRALEVWRAL